MSKKMSIMNQYWAVGYRQACQDIYDKFKDFEPKGGLPKHLENTIKELLKEWGIE